MNRCRCGKQIPDMKGFCFDCVFILKVKRGLRNLRAKGKPIPKQLMQDILDNPKLQQRLQKELNLFEKLKEVK